MIECSQIEPGGQQARKGGVMVQCIDFFFKLSNAIATKSLSCNKQRKQVCLDSRDLSNTQDLMEGGYKICSRDAPIPEKRQIVPDTDTNTDTHIFLVGRCWYWPIAVILNLRLGLVKQGSKTCKAGFRFPHTYL